MAFPVVWHPEEMIMTKARTIMNNANLFSFKLLTPLYYRSQRMKILRFINVMEILISETLKILEIFIYFYFKSFI